MWGVTGWAAATWLKITTALTLVIGLCWLLLGTGSVLFWAAAAAAALIEVKATRALASEWSAEARYTWWWAR